MGPLTGLTLIEFEGIGPAPYCGMLLADMGVDVIMIERAGMNMQGPSDKDPTRRGKRSIVLDLKKPEDQAIARKLCLKADILLEGFRPGTLERLGLGPDDLMGENPGLIYGRLTGWGQTGPLAQTAGHDINFIALSGALAHLGDPDQPPMPPLNLIGDYGGGTMFLIMGILAAVIERQRPGPNHGKGQVIDAAITDGTTSMMTLFYGLTAQGRWQDTRGQNMLDGGAPFYRCYQTKDGKYISIGAIEPQFYSLLLEKLDVNPDDFEPQHDQGRWPDYARKFTDIFLKKTRNQWCDLLEGTDACFAPVLAIDEVGEHPHHQHRQTIIEEGGIPQPNRAPRFSRSATNPGKTLPEKDQNRAEILAQLGRN